MTTVDKVIQGANLGSLGGFLRCEECGLKRPLGDVGDKLMRGWPKHCNLTMRWWTQRQIDAGEALDA